MRRSLLLGLFAFLSPFAPVAAGTAYVPLAANAAIGAATYRTLLILTNTGSANAGFSVTFLASGTDGTAGRPQPATYGLSPGTTLRIYNAVPAGARGMLEVAGDGAIAVSARVEAIGANGAVLASGELPVVGAPLNAGDHAELPGLEQSAAGAVTDLGLMNLGGAAAHCTVQGFRTGGSPIGKAVNLTLKPLSNNDYRTALATLGESAIKDARFDVTCDQSFGTYAFVYRAGGPETVALGPAARLDGDLTPDASGGVTFNLPGAFANGTTFAGYDLPLQAGVQYTQAHIEFDLAIDKWQKAFPFNPMYHNVASFRRTASSRKDRVLYWGLIFKGTGDYRTILDMGIPPGQTEGTTIRSGSGPWKEHTTYHIVLDYDTAAGTVTFQAYQGGALVQRMSGPLNNLDISNLSGKTVRIDFSSVGVGDGAYFPTTGWKYSNLAVKLTPRR